jgi:hypothetical protein
MRRSIPMAFVCAIAALQTLYAQPSAAPLPVRRVVLYKNGIGYFEHVGRVRGNQSLAIDFNSAQLNDVLKSLTTIDLGDGRIGNVSFNTDAPLTQRLGALTLPVGERTTLVDLLGALRGARLELRDGGRLVSGRLLSVERRIRGKDEAPRDELTVVSDAGVVRSVDLTPAVSVRLAQRELADQVGAYLGLLDSTRGQSRRRMTIAAIGAGERDILVSYVSEVPVWKMTYRIVLPSGEGGRPLLQGWAVVDNTVGEDWNDVELSLVAGAPQSFIQQLSQPQYVPRPVVGISRMTSPMPQTHGATLNESVAGNSAQSHDQVVRGGGVAGGVGSGIGGAMPPRLGGVAGGVVGGLEAPPPPAAPRALTDRADIEQRLAAMQTAAQGQELGDLFEYRVAGPITIAKNQSALVPIVKAEVAVERVSLWNERVGARPLRSLWLTNSSGSTLDGGSFTVLDEATFAGEGLIEPMKPGERRLLSYAVDLGVQVEAHNGDSLDQLTHIRIDRGTLVHQSEQRTRKVYTVRNNDASSRTVVIEHPIRAGWTLGHDLKPVETSLNAYRFAVAVSAQSTVTLTIDERRPTEQQLSVSTLTEQHLAFFVRATRADANLARALAPISAKKAAIASLEQELKAREAESTRIAEDQARLRDNMRSLKGSDGEKQLLKRYVSQLNEQEDRIAALRREAADISQRIARAQAELSQLIETLSVDVDLRETD